HPRDQPYLSQAPPTLTPNASPAASHLVRPSFTFSATATFHDPPSSAPRRSAGLTLYNSDCSVSTGVSGSGTISGNTATFSASFTPTATGTYPWLASYAGDANNNGFTTSCGDSGEQLTVIKATPTTTTSASPAASQ